MSQDSGSLTQSEIDQIAQFVADMAPSLRDSVVLGGKAALNLFADTLARSGDPATAAQARAFAVIFEAELKK